MPDPRPEDLLEQACSRLRSALERQAPWLASHVVQWIDLDRLRHPGFLPLFALPVWVERSLRGAADPELQASLSYSTLNGYCYARLMDDVMDDDLPEARLLLPAAALFHTEFQLVYQHFFPADHRFWLLFRDVWHGSQDAAAENAAAGSVKRSTFERVAARKLQAIRIPVAAVCYRCGREERLAGWSDVCDRLAAFHQFADDLSDWVADRREGRSTYLLGEADRRRRPDEDLAAWICREGLAWGKERLREYGAAVVRGARALECPDLERYAAGRLAVLEHRVDELAAALRALGRIVSSASSAGR